MKKVQLRNIFTKTILASSVLYAGTSIAAPCVYSFDSQTIGPNIVCSSTNATESPFSSFVSTLKFNGTVTIPANVIPITNTGTAGVTILAGNVNFTKAVTVTDVLATTNARGLFIQQGNTTMAGGITISNANAPLTSGIEIRGDNATPTSFNIASITASNNNSYGLWITNKITSGIISGPVSISNTDRNYNGVLTNVDQAYGIKIDLSATPVFNGTVTLTNNQIASGAKLGLGTGIDIKSNAYAKFNSDVTISVPPFVATSNTTGIQVTNAKADFSTVKTENHKLHIGVDNSTVVMSGPLTILEAWSLGPSKTGIKAINAGNLSLKSTVDIIGGVTYGVDISGTNTSVTFAKAVNILDNYNAINVSNNGKAVFSDSVIINRFNGVITNSQGISISSASGQFDGAVSISNMENKALNIQNASPVFNNTISLGDNKTGIYVDGTSVPVFNKSVTSSNKIVSGVFNSDTAIKISGANAKANFLGGVSINNSLTGISIDTKANPTFAGIDITQDLSGSGNTKLLPTDGILFTGNATGKFDGIVIISNMTNNGLNIQNSSPVFNKLVLFSDNQTGISISQGSNVNFADGISGSYNSTVSSKNTIGLQVVNSQATFNKAVNIKDHEINILADNSTILFTDVVSVSDSGLNATPKTGIKFINAANSTFNGTVNLNLGPNPTVAAGLSTGIDISGPNTISTFKGLVRAENVYSAINISNGGKGIFAGTVSVSRPNLALTNLQGINISSADGDFSGGVGIVGMDLSAINISKSSPSFGLVNIASSKQGIVVNNNSAPIFTGSVTILDNTNGIFVDGTSAPVFNKTVTSSNSIVSGVFNSDNSIKLSGANSKANFLSAVTINNSLTGISLDTKANPTFADITITQDLGPSGNTKLLPTDGILFATSATGTFSGAVSINNMTNKALNIVDSSPVFNNSVTLLDNKNGIFIDGASAPIFNKAVNISKTDTINVLVEIGIEITDSSTPIFTSDVSVTKNKYGISISDNSDATFVGVVDVNNNRGPVLGDPFSPIGVYGIKIIDNSNSTFKGDVVIADNYYKHIVDVNPSAGYSRVARGIYIDDNSSAYFGGSVTTSMLNYPQQLSEGIRISNNSSADFDGSVSTTSHYQGIIVDQSSKAVFNNNVQMLEERVTVPLNNSVGLTVDNNSEVLFNSDVTANSFWISGIEIKNGSLANFQGVVTAKNNESPVANTGLNMESGSNAINISDSTVIFDKQPVLDSNYNAIKISGATSDVTFSTDLLFSNNKSYGINLLDVSDINFKNITYNSDSASYFSTFFNAKSSKATFNGTVECNSGLCLKIDNASNIVFNEIFTANNTSTPSPFLLNTTAVNSQQDNQLIFNKAVNIDGFYTGINSIEDDYLSFRDTVNITNTKGFGINLLQSQLAEFKQGVSIEGEFNGSSGYGIYIGGYFSAPDPHKVIFYGDVDIKNQFTGIYLENSNIEFQKVVNVESEINQSSGYGIYIPAQFNDSSLNKVIFADDVIIKNQSIAGLYLEKNNTVFNGNVTIEDSYHSLFSNASADLTTNPTPIFNKNVTINNGVNGILVTGGELIFNGPVVINKSSFKGMNIASGGNNGENSKLYFNETVEVNDCAVGISTYNEFASNYLFFEKGLTINNPNIPATNEVEMSYDDYITFKGDSPVNAQIKGGIITFTGAPAISRTIEDAQIVDFTLSDSSKRISVNADIGGTEIYTNAVKMGIDSNITFTGNLHADNTIFDLSTKILTIDGTFTHGTNPVSQFVSFALNPVGGITIDTYYDGTNAGHFEFATPSTVIDLSNSSKMIINITEATGIPVLLPGETRQFDLFVGNGVSNFQLIDANNITISTNNPLSKWTIDTQEGILYQSLKTGGVGNMFKMVDSDGVTDLLMNSDDFVQELVDIIMDKGPIAGADALNKIGNPDAVIAASAPLSNIETGIIDTRLSSVIGAGDEEPIYGAWFAPLYAKATQKEREGQPGFKSTYFGGIIGFDSKIDEYLSIGVAAGISDGKLNHTDSNKGDRTDHKAYVGIIYLSYDLTERWMLQNTFSYGFSKVHNKEIRISTPVNKIARAKYDERRISNNIGLGYKTLLSNEMLFIPFLALDFNRVGSIQYTETGADIQNLKFNRSSLTEVDGIIGARLSKNFQYEDFVITPAVVANIRYAISGQEFKTDVRLASDDTIQIVPKTVSPARKLYRLGASVNINNKDKDFLINYEFRKAEKFTSHQGSLKIQISF